MKPEEIKLAYLLISAPKPNVFIGGMMITDGRGLPVEFRYTEPIQPSKIQQILYGEKLSSYIKRDVIAETLIRNVEAKFKYLLVGDENLLTYPVKGITMIRITETKSAPLGGLGKFQEISPTEILLQASRDGCPVRVFLNDPTKAPAPAGVEAVPAGVGAAAEPATPAAAGSEEGKLPASLELLVEAGQYMDIHEPLKRIEKALETICQEEGLK
jgi:hypothetical protein